MEMDVAVPAHAKEFNFDSTNSSPYITAPSSPTRFGNSFFFFSAPASPSRSDSSSFRESNIIISDWDEKQSTPESSASAEFSRNRTQNDFTDDFEFNFSGQLEKGSLSAADELFQGGKIRPLIPGFDQSSTVSSPTSSSISRDLKKDGFGSSEKKTEETRKREEFDQKQRGRERSQGSFLGYVHKGSRSLSPLRVSDIMLEDQEEKNSRSDKFVASTASNQNPSISSLIFSAFSFPGRAYEKWRLKDLLLFRSASEGRATEAKEALKRYDVLSKKEREEGKNTSFRWAESSGSGSSSAAGSRRRGLPVSAHELHYTANRAVSGELKRKTFLPYKQGWLGCLGFNPGVHDISRVGSLTRGGS